MSDELKPCPHCGVTPEIVGDGVWPVCKCYMEEYEDGPLDINAWNNRPIEDALRTRIAELETEPTELRTRLAVCESALISMVQQFFYSAEGSNVYSHAFMSAEEEAADYLVGNGLAVWNDEQHSTIVFPEVKE